MHGVNFNLKGLFSLPTVSSTLTIRFWVRVAVLYMFQRGECIYLAKLKISLHMIFKSIIVNYYQTLWFFN